MRTPTNPTGEKTYWVLRVVDTGEYQEPVGHGRDLSRAARFDERTAKHIAGNNPYYEAREVHPGLGLIPKVTR